MVDSLSFHAVLDSSKPTEVGCGYSGTGPIRAGFLNFLGTHRLNFLDPAPGLSDLHDRSMPIQIWTPFFPDNSEYCLNMDMPDTVSSS